MVVVRHSFVRVGRSVWIISVSLSNEFSMDSGSVTVQNMDTVIKSNEIDQFVSDSSSQAWNFIDPVV